MVTHSFHGYVILGLDHMFTCSIHQHTQLFTQMKTGQQDRAAFLCRHRHAVGDDDRAYDMRLLQGTVYRDIVSCPFQSHNPPSVNPYAL